MPSGRRSTVAPKLCITSTCGSISRMPRLQPFTSSSMRATPKRDSSPGTSMMLLRISSGRRCTASSKRVCWWCTSRMRAWKSTSTWLPSVRKISRIFFTSVISGMPRRRTGSVVSSVAHRMGRTAFLFAEGTRRPRKGVPPWTMRSDMGDEGPRPGQ